MESLIALIWVILVLALIGLCVWLIEKYIPMDDIFKTAIRIIVVIAVILFLITQYLLPAIRGGGFPR